MSEKKATAAEGGEIVRFTPHELAQHWLLLVTLTVLALTGLALFFHASWLGRALIALEGGIESRSEIHRGAAIALMVLVAWHFVYVVFTERGHRQLMETLPHRRDCSDVVRLIGYYLGRQPTMPEFGRFTPLQKLQYWGAGIGSVTMVATGLVLWFHTQAMAVMPKWVIDATTIVHGYEGLLLFALLFGWHLYIVHLSPGNFPMQRTFLTGRISRERMWREHRQEYRELLGETPPNPAAPEPGKENH